MKQSKISRRSFLLGLGAVSTAALLAACGEAASSAPASSAASSEAPASSASEVPAAPILTEDEFPVTDGSTACIPLIAQIIRRHLFQNSLILVIFVFQVRPESD